VVHAHASRPLPYQEWLASVPVPAPLREQGRQTFARLGCAECHGGDANRAPSLDALAGSQVTLASGGRAVADENYLRTAILDPGEHVVAGYDPVMPSFRGQVDEEELAALISYLKSLPGTRAARTEATAESVVR